MPRYIKAEPGPKHSVIYTDSNGKQWKFEGGTRPWRNQNPGNLVPCNVSKRNGAIGKDAVVTISPRGNRFLRARPNSSISDNLKVKG